MKLLIVLIIAFFSKSLEAKQKDCESKFRRLKIKLELSTLEKIESYTPKFIKDKPECEKDVIEVARYLRTQFADKMSVEYLVKYDGKKKLDEVLPLTQEELRRYGINVGQREGSYFLADQEVYYLRFRSDRESIEGESYIELVTDYEKVMKLDDGSLKSSFEDVARLLISIERFILTYPEYEKQANTEKVLFIRQVLSGLLDNSPCMNAKNFKLEKQCSDALDIILNLEDEIPSQKLFEPIVNLARSKKKSNRKKAFQRLQKIAKGQ